MPLTRVTLVVVATVIAWLGYAMGAAEAGGTPSVGVDIARIVAFSLTALIVVRAAGLLVTELLIEQHWEIAATSLIRLLIYLLFSGIAIALLLRFAFNIDITTLLTTSALVSVIVGIALQPTLAALFAGLAIQIEHQLRTGDIIRLGNHLAVVEAMRWRSIAARRADGTLIIVPNAQLVSQQVEIQRPTALATIEVLVPGPLSTPPLAVEEIIEDTLLDMPGIDRGHPATATLADMDPSDHIANFRVRFSVRADSLLDESRYTTLLRTRLWYVYQRHGITLFAPRRDRRENESSGREADGSGSTQQRPPEDLRLRAPVTRALSASRRWHNADDLERYRATRGGVTLLYGSRESIRLPHGWDHAIALLVSGQILWQGEAPLDGIAIEAPLLEQASEFVAQDWEPQMLADIRERLADAIGPYAHRAVAMAAQEAPNKAALHYRLAQLIEYGPERDAFMHSAPPEHAREFGIGTVLLLSHSNRAINVPLYAHRQVELLAIPSANR